jgi:hypothetical protein
MDSEGEMTGVKRVRRRIKNLLDDLRNKRVYWKIKEKTEIKKVESTFCHINMRIYKLSSLTPFTC